MVWKSFSLDTVRSRVQAGERSYEACIWPASISLALHANSVAVPWSLWRLEAIEVWLSQQLHRAATRDGSSLQSLPPAKQDRRWPHLHLEAGPFRP